MVTPRIRTRRTETGWCQAHLGQLVGTDSQRISRYETGKITPSLDALIRLAQALDVACDHLLLDDAPRHPLTPADTTTTEAPQKTSTSTSKPSTNSTKTHKQPSATSSKAHSSATKPANSPASTQRQS